MIYDSFHSIGLYFLFLIPGLLLGIWAQIKLRHAYGKYSQVPVDSGMTGAEAARRILDSAGLRDMPVEEVPGLLGVGVRRGAVGVQVDDLDIGQLRPAGHQRVDQHVRGGTRALGEDPLAGLNAADRLRPRP